MDEMIENTTETTEQAVAENGGGDPASTTESEKSEKTFTQAELDAIIDKRLAREKAQYDKQLSEKLSEAQKLAKMNADQKAQYEREQAEKKLAERELAITKRELVATAKETLSAKGMPAELHEILNYSDADSCRESIEAVSAAFSQAVEKAVNEKLRGNPPHKGNSENTSKDPFLDGLGV